MRLLREPTHIWVGLQTKCFISVKTWQNIFSSISRFCLNILITPYFLLTNQAGLAFILNSETDPIDPPPAKQQIDWVHLLLPAMIHLLFCAIALLVFMIQIFRALCKYLYGYDTVLSSYWYCVQARGDRQLARQDRRLILRTERILRTVMTLWELRTYL